jgi:hypothetical protein
MGFDSKRGAQLVTSPATPTQNPEASPEKSEKPRYRRPIPYTKEFFPFTNLCVCGREVPKEWTVGIMGDFYKTEAWVRSHGHCSHAPASEPCKICEELK